METTMLTRNMHRIDQFIRIILGALMIYFGFFDRSLISDELFGMLLGVLGVINLGSAVVGICPVYLIAGINTCKTAKTSG